MRFRVGDRVVSTAKLAIGAAGEVVRRYMYEEDEIDGYGVLFDSQEYRGPFGDGGVFMADNELQYEEEK